MATEWKEGLWRTHTCQIGVFTLRLQEDMGGKWKSDLNGLSAKARWDSLETAKVRALKVWGDMLADAVRAAIGGQDDL